MSKPFLVINVVEGDIGQIKERDNWDDAVDIAVALAAEQCDTPVEEIRAELSKDNSFYGPIGNDIKVFIAQTDDD
jgi:hypothetical protein